VPGIAIWFLRSRQYPYHFGIEIKFGLKTFESPPGLTPLMLIVSARDLIGKGVNGFK
jgi:hypothetical protein